MEFEAIMLNSIITHLQIFGIGFSFGIAGPCFLLCTPVLITYVVGTKKDWGSVLRDVTTFLSGRLVAYMVLGFLAGLSGAVLKQFTSLSVASYSRPLAGAITIFFAFIILLNRENHECSCPAPYGRMLNFGGIFTFGLLIGLSPCAPLLALLFDIVLLAKGPLSGMFYALSFGLGTFLSGLITIGVLTGLLAKIPAALIRSKTVNIIFKIACALLLIAMGLGLILKKP